MNEAHIHLERSRLCVRWTPRGVPYRIIGIDLTHDSRTITYEVIDDHVQFTHWCRVRPVERCGSEYTS